MAHSPPPRQPPYRNTPLSHPHKDLEQQQIPSMLIGHTFATQSHRPAGRLSIERGWTDDHTLQPQPAETPAATQHH